MPRPITGELGIATQQERSEFAHLIEFQFVNGIIRMTTGAVDLVTDPYAAAFTGAVSEKMIRDSIAGVWPTTELSVEGWCKLNVGPSSVNRYVFHYGAPGQDLEILLGINGIASGGSTWYVTGWVGGNSTTSSPNAFPNDQGWHHIAMTYRSSDGQTKLYLDGVLVQTTTLSSGTILGSGWMTVGSYQQPQGTHAGQWNGNIDEVRIYRRVLTDAEMAEHYNRRFINEQKLVAHWKFDATPGQRLVTNPGFETGDASGWTLVTGFTVVNNNARTGGWSLRYDGNDAGGPNALIANTEALKVKPGDHVFAECWMKGVGSIGTTQLAIRFRDANHTQITRELVGSLTGPVAAYTQVKGTVIAPAGAVYAILDIGENTSNNSGTPWYFDDVILSISQGKDSGPMGNHLTPIGLLTTSSNTILRKAWSAVGGLLQFGGVEETADARAQGTDVRLSGVTQLAIAALLSSPSNRGRKASVWRAHVDETTGEVIDAPLLLIEGLQLAPYEIQEERSREGGTVTVRTRIRGKLGAERLRGIWTNLVAHQHYFPGDTFFQHVTALENVRAFWGVPWPWGSGPGAGGPNGGVDDGGSGGPNGDGTQWEM